MIQVLEKAVNILDYLSQNSTREVPLSELADSLGINRPTCANIMKSLKDLALVEQTDYRGGYILGDKVYSLSGSNTNYQKVEHLIVELYTKNKDFTLEASLEGVLSSYGLVYTRSEQYIGSERMWEVVYETDVIITEELTNVQQD